MKKIVLLLAASAYAVHSQAQNESDVSFYSKTIQEQEVEKSVLAPKENWVASLAVMVVAGIATSTPSFALAPLAAGPVLRSDINYKYGDEETLDK